MTRLLFAFILCLGFHCVTAQYYTDFVGAGHMEGVTVTTSHSSSLENLGEKTIDGFPVTEPEALYDASRFLAQATMGYDYETIERVAAMGLDKWLDEQFEIPPVSAMEISSEVIEAFGLDFGELYGVYEFRSIWWNMILLHPDLLRQRITHSLGQIYVISSFGNSFFINVPELSNAYYDILNRNAFGNFRDLLSEVSRSASMGKYLSHINNPKSDPLNNIFPDENYAREIMQLFTIGLYELNQDGSRILDSAGNFIPTYDNDDIREFAKVFTGFGDGRPNGQFGVFTQANAEFGSHIPMRMYDDFHEEGEKQLLYGEVVSDGQGGLDDFEDAIDNLFHHPNVGPFIGKALIQFLVTANPSPAYVSRVAAAFNDNGDGVRGDMKAVIKAILLDPEARHCDPLAQQEAGKLREPIVRYTGYLKAFNPSPTGIFIIHPTDRWYARTAQVPLYANSVFNFYSPEFQPNGPIAGQDLVAPVFQIHNSTTSIGYINEVTNWTFSGQLTEDITALLDNLGISSGGIALDFSDEHDLFGDDAALVERLNILLAAGQLSQRSKDIIANAISPLLINRDKVKFASYLVMIAPEYAVLK